MLRAVPCLFSERWRERRTTTRHRQFAGPWLAGACCCRGLCRHGEGRGRGGGATIKRTATVSRAPLRRGKQRGEVAGSRGLSTIKTARIYSFTENKLVFFFVPYQKKVIRPPGFSPARQHPATSTNKCQEKDNTSAITHSRSGAERSDKQRTNEEEETHRLRSTVAFSMHTLCARGTMKPEINAAVGFLSRFLRVKGHVNDRQVQTFNQSLQDILSGTYKTKTENPQQQKKIQTWRPSPVNTPTHFNVLFFPSLTFIRRNVRWQDRAFRSLPLFSGLSQPVAATRTSACSRQRR